MRKLVTVLLVVLSFGIFTAVANADYAATILADSPVAYWQLDETSGTFESAVDFNYPGSDFFEAEGDNSLTRGAPGIVGNGISLANPINNTAPTGLASVTNNTGMQPGLGSWTMEAWFNTDANWATATSTGNILRKADGARNGFYLIMNKGSAAGRVTAGFARPDTGLGVAYDVIHVSSPVPGVSMGEWHHVVGTLERNTTATSDTATLYIDGVMMEEKTSYNLFGVDISPTGRLAIGAGNTVLYGFDGSIDEVAMYNYALSASQVAAHYAAVPEPSTILLLSSGIICLLAYAWRKRK